MMWALWALYGLAVSAVVSVFVGTWMEKKGRTR